jgi:hypothetical protein
MGLGAIVVGLFLFLFLLIFTLLINPPNAWVQKFTGKDKDKNRR